MISHITAHYVPPTTPTYYSFILEKLRTPNQSPPECSVTLSIHSAPLHLLWPLAAPELVHRLAAIFSASLRLVCPLGILGSFSTASLNSLTSMRISSSLDLDNFLG